MFYYLLFLYTCCLSFCLSIWFPSLHVFYFIPFLLIGFYRYPLKTCLWWALVCGSLVDLLSSHTPMGTHAAIYCLVMCYLYRYKFYFFEERLSILPLMTMYFACCITILQTLFLFVGKEMAGAFTFNWVMNLLWSSLREGIYATIAFTIPLYSLSKIKRNFSVFY
jgi:rod shape-determining protein MreD